MLRSLATVSCFAAALVPAAASANDALCAEMSPRPLAVWVSADPAEVAAPAEAPAKRDEPAVLWCFSANDPRCMPAGPSPESLQSLLGGAPIWARVAHGDVPAPAETTMTFPRTSDRPREGVRSRVDRPPRA